LLFILKLCHDDCQSCSKLNVASWALSCMCTHQYLEFWGKAFWPSLYPSNVMCYMYCMIVLAMLSWANGQYEAEICTLCSFE
jgi:hypothetical protein